MKIGLWHEIPDKTYWKDGLWAAIELLKKEHEIVEFEEGEINLVESGVQGSCIAKVLPFKERVIWFHAGGTAMNHGFKTTVVLAPQLQRDFKKIGVDTVVINGTNTDLFKPMNLEKVYDVIFPAAFARWKRHELLIKWVQDAGIEPSKVLAIGHKQHVEQECFEICEKAGFVVRGLVPPEELAVLYNQSKECWLPSELWGGSEKATWEARACGLPVRVAPDNERLNELLTLPVHSHYYYAERIKELL